MNDESAGSNDSIHLKYTLSSREIRRAWWSALLRSPFPWVILVLAAILAILPLLGAIDHGPSASSRWLVALLLFLFLLLVLLLVLLLLEAILIFALSALASRQLGPQALVIDEAGVTSTTANTETRIDWKVYPRAVELRAAYSLRKGRSKFLIPKRAFETVGSEEQFRLLCAKHCKSNPRLRPR